MFGTIVGIYEQIQNILSAYSYIQIKYKELYYIIII